MILDPTIIGSHLPRAGKDVAERVDAVHQARDVLDGTEWEVEDVLVVADWLLTGRADLALAVAAQASRNCRDRDGDVSPDAARWTPGRAS